MFGPMGLTLTTELQPAIEDAMNLSPSGIRRRKQSAFKDAATTAGDSPALLE